MSRLSLSSRSNRIEIMKPFKLSKSRDFRIKSVSREKLNSLQKINTIIMSQESSQPFFSCEKEKRSGPSDVKNKSNLKKITQPTLGTSKDKVEIIENFKRSEKCESHNKLVRTEEEEKDFLLRKNEIAKIFDPKTIQRMGRKKSENSHSNIKYPEYCRRGEFRVNRYIFESKITKSKENNLDFMEEEYWKNVNESLILPVYPKAEDEISKDLKEIYQNFVTE